MSQEELEILIQHDRTSPDENKKEKQEVNVNELKDDGQKCKSLLIANESDANITLYIYTAWSPFCMFSTISKIIEPKKNYLYQKETSFKFELFAMPEDELNKKDEEKEKNKKENDKKKIKNNEKKEVKEKNKQKKKKLLGPLKLLEDKAIRITKTLEYREENLADFPNEKRVCLRKIHREEELETAAGMSNLYDILGLDMNDVRKMKKEEAKKEKIKEAYHKQMRIWHPDKNFGDGEIAQQIIVAKKILLDDARRARYHNAVDYDKGFFSRRRWKAVFRPERCTDEQNKAFWKRIAMFAPSLVLGLGGLALSVATAGAATPVLVICGAIFGTGFTGASLLSLTHTVSKKSVLDGCDVKSWLLKGAFGFIGGAATGGVGVGITAAVVGIGSAALQSSAVSVGQYIVIGMGTGALGGVARSLSSDAARVLVDGESISIRQLIYRACAGAVIGLIAGCLGGLVTKGIVNSQASASTSTLQGDVAEQLAISTGGRRLAKALVLNVSRELTESGADAIFGTASQVLEERLDDSVENQHPSKHAARAVTTLATKVVKGAAEQTASSCVAHCYNKWKVAKKAKDISEQPSNWRRLKGSASYTPDEETYPTNSLTSKDPGEQKQSSSTQQKTYVISEELEATESSIIELYEENQQTCYQSDDEEEDYSMNGMIKYRSGGYWFSKMIVSYSLNGKEIRQEVRSDGARVFIPADATDIVVRFQVRRPFWGDIKKYDRFNKTWCKPYEPHVFRYERPVNRTFTIFGNLWWEAVMRVSDEYHEETNEMR